MSINNNLNFKLISKSSNALFNAKCSTIDELMMSCVMSVCSVWWKLHSIIIGSKPRKNKFKGDFRFDFLNTNRQLDHFRRLRSWLELRISTRTVSILFTVSGSFYFSFCLLIPSGAPQFIKLNEVYVSSIIIIHSVGSLSQILSSSPQSNEKIETIILTFTHTHTHSHART